jgi:DNA gyrase inhibitor GyrI
MQTDALKREDILDKLMEMEKQLEQLDRSIVFKISQQNQRWEREQKVRLESCVSQLENLERKMTSNQEHTEINSLSYQLKLSC